MQYLNTSFLGARQFVEAGPVNYTFFQFGPINPAATGMSLLVQALLRHRTDFRISMHAAVLCT